MYNQNYIQDPTQARLNALYLQLCSQDGGNGTTGQLILDDNCFVMLTPTGKESTKLCLDGFSFPGTNASLINVDLLPGDSTFLFDNQLRNFYATQLISSKNYVRGVLILVTYPSLDANGVTVNPSLYTCRLNVTTLPNSTSGVHAPGGVLQIQAPGNTVELNPQVAPYGGVIISKYAWTKDVFPPGDASIIVSPNAQSTKIIDLIPGEYSFKLQITDSNNVVKIAQYNILVTDAGATPPEISAGQNQIVSYEDTQIAPVVLTGTAIYFGATPTNISWTQLSGPTVATFSAPNSLQTNVSNLSPGIYSFVLRVTDSNNFTSNASVTVTVTDMQNIDMPLSSFYAHFCNPVTTDATQILNSISIENISNSMPICVQALLVSGKADPNTTGSLNNTCNC